MGSVCSRQGSVILVMITLSNLRYFCTTYIQEQSNFVGPTGLQPEAGCNHITCQYLHIELELSCSMTVIAENDCPRVSVFS